jgi:hypothetical protein
VSAKKIETHLTALSIDEEAVEAAAFTWPHYNSPSAI